MQLFQDNAFSFSLFVMRPISLKNCLTELLVCVLHFFMHFYTEIKWFCCCCNNEYLQCNFLVLFILSLSSSQIDRWKKNSPETKKLFEKHTFTQNLNKTLLVNLWAQIWIYIFVEIPLSLSFAVEFEWSTLVQILIFFFLLCYYYTSKIHNKCYLIKTYISGGIH